MFFFFFVEFDLFELFLFITKNWFMYTKEFFLNFFRLFLSWRDKCRLKKKNCDENLNDISIDTNAITALTGDKIPFISSSKISLGEINESKVRDVVHKTGWEIQWNANWTVRFSPRPLFMAIEMRIAISYQLNKCDLMIRNDDNHSYTSFLINFVIAYMAGIGSDCVEIMVVMRSDILINASAKI